MAYNNILLIYNESSTTSKNNLYISILSFHSIPGELKDNKQ